MFNLLQRLAAGRSLTTWFVSCGVTLAALLLAAGWWRRLPRLRIAALAVLLATLTTWLAAWIARPVWLRAASADPTTIPIAAAPAWTTRAPGLETAELPVIFHGEEVDRIDLVRLEPRHWRFAVQLDRSRSRTLADWQRLIGTGVVVNGSYFQPDGTPSTPIRVAGQAFGPREYESSHGALVIPADGPPAILDLLGHDPLAAIAGAPDALVSYPLLVDAAGAVRAEGRPDWLATRSFVAVDGSGRVVIGTTETGFFSLHRLGGFLAAAPLDLRLALNLDGGPLAAQSVSVPGFHRAVQGEAELNDNLDVTRIWWQELVRKEWPLPIVLVMTPRE
jgi:hypothetical protein